LAAKVKGPAARTNRHSVQAAPKMVLFQDPERSVLSVGEHRKLEKRHLQAGMG
jgi:hypothetical protein